MRDSQLLDGECWDFYVSVHMSWLPSGKHGLKWERLAVAERGAFQFDGVLAAVDKGSIALPAGHFYSYGALLDAEEACTDARS